ncbi:MAG: arginine--tRNA ligase [Proteobacteria bacterium]|nr:arginine--tRNA ligase [Pseudomonadota bacterium]
MKKIIKDILLKRLDELNSSLPVQAPDFFEIEVPKKKEFGDFSTNIALVLSKSMKKNPREIATLIVSEFKNDLFSKIEIAGPGFINFFLNDSMVRKILEDRSENFDYFLSPKSENKKRIFIEYVSANPTGPLHVGHGRGACIGSSLSNILKELGHEIHQEFYINDAGSQIKNLGLSIILRAKELKGENVEYTKDCYMGEYITDIAREFMKKYDNLDISEYFINEASRFGKNLVLGWIKKDLEDFGVNFDNFQSELELFERGYVNECIKVMRNKGLIYEKDGALWFKSTDFLDDKDRVMVKENGEKTYFASDVAYHKLKFERDYDIYINIWGADHHGYVPRVKSAIKALGYDESKLKILMVQMVSLFRDGKPVTMSKRTGDFVTLREVLDEVGKEPMRFTFLTRKHDSPLDFDIELVKQKTSDNPVFYVQYMYARINSVFKVAEERGIKIPAKLSFNRLTLEEERELIKQILAFPDVLFDVEFFLEPHLLTYYLINLAQLFHSYYNAHRFINGNDIELTNCRLSLLFLLQKLIKKGLYLLGIETPERM